MAFVIRRNEVIDAFCKPFRPLVFDQGGRIGELGALDVRIGEFAGVEKDPLGGELRHGHGLGRELVERVDGMFGDGFKPAVVGAVVRTKWHPLSVDNDNARPDLAEDPGEFT